MHEHTNLPFLVLIVAVATIGGFMFGYDSGVINGTQEGLRMTFGLTELGMGLSVGAILVGCAVGAFIAGRISDLIGRRKVMMLAALLFILSAIGTGAAHTSSVFFFARFIGGLGVGAASVISPVYISEVVPANIRGRLSSVQQIMIIAGLTAAFIANYLFAAYAGSSTSSFWLDYPAWRWMFWAQLVPASIYLVAIIPIPESPRWLVMKGRDDEAARVLTKLIGPSAAQTKVAEIRASLSSDAGQPSLLDLRDPQSGRLRRVVKAGIGIAIFQQLSGIVVVFYYGAVLWQSVGFSENDALKINILSGSLSIISCLVAISVIDHLGRRPLLLWGGIGKAVALAVMAVCFSTVTFVDGIPHLSDGVGLVALIAANVFVMIFNGTWGPVMWVMLGEMFPNQIRGSGLAVSGAAQWGANFTMTFSFPVLAAGIGLSFTYGIYAVFSLIAFFFVARMVVETRGRELEDMK